MNLSLRTLRYVVTLAQKLSFGRAAGELGISQPALSRAIQAFEKQQGTRIFDRDRSGVTLTPQGALLVDQAIILLANADDLERHFDSTARGSKGRVRFGLAPMPARALLPAVLGEMMRSDPDVVCEVAVRSVDLLWPLLIAGEIEFFVSAEGQVPATPPTRAETLGHFPISLIVRPGHPLLKGDDPGSTFPFLISSAPRGTFPDDIQRHVRGSPYVVDDSGALVGLTAHSDAVWISSSYAVAAELGAGTLAEVPRPPDSQWRQAKVVIYMLDRRSQSPIALRLKARFREVVRALGKEAG